MTKAIVLKPFPYSDGGKVIKFKAGDTFDFPPRQFNGLEASDYVRPEYDPVPVTASETAVDKPKRRRRKGRNMFPEGGA